MKLNSARNSYINHSNLIQLSRGEK